MFDTISIGSATLDIFLKSNHFSLVEDLPQLDGAEGLCLRYGSKLDVDDFMMQSGGGGTNTAVGLARAGLKAAVIAELGQDLPAQVILQELTNEKVDTSMVVQEADEKTAISALLVSGEGGRSIVTARGASKMLTVEDINFAKLKAHWIHISSLGSAELVQAIAAHCKQKRIRFSWNPGGAELQAMIEGQLHPSEIYPTLFVVNDEEAAKLKEAGYEIEGTGSTVIVTTGAEGGRFFEHGRWQDFKTETVPVVQTTGAGDAFIAGAIAAYLHDRLTKEAVQWGKANAQAVIGQMGAKTGLRRDFDFIKKQFG